MLKKHLTLLLFLCATCALHAANYLTFTAEADSSSFGITNKYGNNPDIQYSLNGGKTWTKLPADTLIPLRKGDKALLKGNNPQGISSIEEYKERKKGRWRTIWKYTAFNMTGRIAASGSVMSLIDGVGKCKEVPNSNCFLFMFLNCVSLTKAPQLTATQLAKDCYCGMFAKCSNLTEAPELPAKSLRSSCYARMFEECTSLTKAPKLPAKQLFFNCYHGMFRGCTSLKEAPKLPATKLAYACYSYMYEN